MHVDILYSLDALQTGHTDRKIDILTADIQTDIHAERQTDSLTHSLTHSLT